MDDVIIIILTLVLTVVAAINQSKKRKQQTPAETSNEPDIWEEILQTGKQKPVPVSQREPVPVNEKPKPRQTREMDGRREMTSWKSKTIKKPAPRFNYENEGGRNEDVLRSSQIGQASDAATSQEGLGESILEDFTLRKAVIFSEIIRPKYF